MEVKTTRHFPKTQNLLQNMPTTAGLVAGIGLGMTYRIATYRSNPGLGIRH